MQEVLLSMLFELRRFRGSFLFINGEIDAADFGSIV